MSLAHPAWSNSLDCPAETNIFSQQLPPSVGTVSRYRQSELLVCTVSEDDPSGQPVENDPLARFHNRSPIFAAPRIVADPRQT
jgi:hypothetical protein